MLQKVTITLKTGSVIILEICYTKIFHVLDCEVSQVGILSKEHTISFHIGLDFD